MWIYTVMLWMLIASTTLQANASPLFRCETSFYKTAFYNSPVPTILLTHDLRVKDMSSYYANLPHREEWMNMPVEHILKARLSEIDANRVLDVVRRARDTGMPQNAEVNDATRQHHWSVQVNTCVTDRNLKHMWRKFRGQPERNVLITMQSTDITGLTQQNTLMRDTAIDADMYHTIVSNIDGYAVYVLDTAGIIRSWNMGAERLKQYTADEVIGQHFSMFYPRDSAASNTPQADLENAMFDHARQLEGWSFRKDGSKFWASIYTQPIFVNGRHIGFVRITRDLTDVMARQEAVWEGQKHAATLKQQFLSTASHEIRSPLTGILSGLDLLRRSEPTSEQAAILDSTTESGNSLLRIVNDILDYSKLEARAMTLHETFTDLHEFTLRRIDTFRARSRVPISLIYPPNVPRHVTVDIERYLQVLTNLVDNAVKFTMSGSIKVSVNIRRRTATQQNMERTLIEIAVSDTGVGLSANDIEGLFKPYSQIYRKENRGGTGLGLAISKQLVELMNGHIWVESNVNGGSTFYFTIDCGLREPKRGDSVPSIVELSQVPLPVTHNIIIVVVDDNPINRRHVKKLLEKSNYNVIDFDSGNSVVTFFENQPVAREVKYIILMDIQMPPGINGLEATMAIHAIEGRKNVPVIGLTANALASDQQACLAAGMHDYITKPFSVEDLLNRIRRLENHLALGVLAD